MNESDTCTYTNTAADHNIMHLGVLATTVYMVWSLHAFLYTQSLSDTTMHLSSYIKLIAYNIPPGSTKRERGKDTKRKERKERGKEKRVIAHMMTLVRKYMILYITGLHPETFVWGGSGHGTLRMSHLLYCRQQLPKE